MNIIQVLHGYVPQTLYVYDNSVVEMCAILETCIVSTVEPPLSGPLLSGTSIVRTAQIGHVAFSLLTIMKFGLDESRPR